ncbi:MAG: N-acetylornithine carbamoyltransferase [Planctomycetota bacterium]
MDAAASPRHVIRLADLEDDVLDDVLELSARLKLRPPRPVLAGLSVGMLFFRRSLRTRASFETAIQRLGGHPVNLTGMADIWELESREGTVMDGSAPEHIRDAAAVLSRYVHALAIRPDPAGISWSVDRRDEMIQTWARHASVPVINMESSLWHPLQSLADLLTLRETLSRLAGETVAVVWTHSPTPASPSVVNSLVHAALRFGMHVRVAHPPGFDLDAEVLAGARELASAGPGSLATGLPREEAVRGARVVYARSWKALDSYGNATLAATQVARHKDWRIDEKLMSVGNDARLMHAMPIRRNVEATDEVIDGPRSLLYEQAANRLPSQMALLAHLLR